MSEVFSGQRTMSADGKTICNHDDKVEAGETKMIEDMIDNAVQDILRRTGTMFILGKEDLESQFTDFLSEVPKSLTLKLYNCITAHNVEVDKEFWSKWQQYMLYMLYLLVDYLTIAKESDFKIVTTGRRFILAREGNNPSYGVIYKAQEDRKRKR